MGLGWIPRGCLGGQLGEGHSGRENAKATYTGQVSSCWDPLEISPLLVRSRLSWWEGLPGKKVRHRCGPGQVTDPHLMEHERTR